MPYGVCVGGGGGRWYNIAGVCVPLRALFQVFDCIIIKVAGNKDMHRRLKGFDFGHIQTADIGVIGPGQLLSYLRTIQNMSLVMRKPTFWFSTWSDTNQAVQLQKIARGLKFRI